jgi:heme O synthase-like polyprenyltransferase
MLGWLIGLPLFGIATVRAHVLPDWCGWLLIAFMPLVLVLFFALGTTPYGYSVGGVVVGLLWLALALGLRSRQIRPAPHQALPDSQSAAHGPLASKVRERDQNT